MRRVDAGRIAPGVGEAGNGPLLLASHGITAKSAMFAPLVVRSSDRFARFSAAIDAGLFGALEARLSARAA
ncbi:hypothetical protein [Martelella soudanensis]|uniref:hypothetical protein n=1 Tax=unclassified Martelella TaxID=2629616 RepID=UPI0015E054BB|nr:MULTISPECIES: hypothetical protein [unclassified Martelella]